MSLATQIETLLSIEVPQIGGTDKVKQLAEKIEALLPDYNAILTASAALENEVTSVLMDMVAATILATLIREEGGGRSNITYSPESMADMTRHFNVVVENNGLLRTVRINIKDGMRDSFFGDEPASGPSVMTDMDQKTFNVKPQAEEHVYDRPIWAIQYWMPSGPGAVEEFVPGLAKMLDRNDAERRIGSYHDDDGRPDATIQNRHCMHPTCPTTGCNEKTEVASDS